MKKNILVIAVVLVGLIIAGVLMMRNVDQNEAKIACLDLNRVFKEYDKTKDYDSKLTAKKNSYVAERDSRIAEFNNFKKMFDGLSDKQKASQQAELEAKAKELRDFISQNEGELGKEVNTKRAEVLKEIKGVAGEYAKKNKITAVFANENMIYQDDRIDITDPIIKMLNEKK